MGERAGRSDQGRGCGAGQPVLCTARSGPATDYRHTRGPVNGPRPARAVPENGQALSAAERAAVVTLINTELYADLSIGQIWACQLDEGRYWCSASSMIRVARATGQSLNGDGWRPPSRGQTGAAGRRPVTGVGLGHRSLRGAVEPCGGEKDTASDWSQSAGRS